MDADYLIDFHIANELRVFLAQLVIPVALISFLFLISIAIKSESWKQITPFLVIQLITIV